MFSKVQIKLKVVPQPLFKSLMIGVATARYGSSRGSGISNNNKVFLFLLLPLFLQQRGLLLLLLSAQSVQNFVRCLRQKKHLVVDHASPDRVRYCFSARSADTAF